MSASFKKKLEKEDMPHNFPLASVETVKRIENNHEVIGILYFREDHLKMCTVPESMVHGLSNKIPQYNAAVIRAVSEIDIKDDLVAYRIESKTNEILVVPEKDFCACVVVRTKKKRVKKINVKSI